MHDSVCWKPEYGKKGTEFVNDDGDVVATLKRDLKFGDLVLIEDFDFIGETPKPGDVAPMPRALWEAMQAEGNVA